MDIVKRILKSVEDGINTPREATRLIKEVMFTDKVPLSQIPEIFALCDTKTLEDIKEFLADIPYLNCDWRHRTAVSGRMLTSGTVEVRRKKAAVRDYCLAENIALPSTGYPEKPFLDLTVEQILGLDPDVWRSPNLYHWVEKHAIGKPLTTLYPELPPHGEKNSKYLYLETLYEKAYVGVLWGILERFHPWERTGSCAFDFKPARIFLVDMEDTAVNLCALFVMQGTEDYSLIEEMWKRFNQHDSREYFSRVKEAFEAGQPFCIIGRPADAIARTLLLAKLSRQKLLAELGVK